MEIIANSCFNIIKFLKRSKMKKETYVCSKCHRTVELIYLPDILPETKKLFDTLFKTKLYKNCYKIN